MLKALAAKVVQHTSSPNVSISSGQPNLMKTYHNDANTSGITKIALKKFLDFFLTKKIDSQNCKNLTFKVIFLRQKLSKS